MQTIAASDVNARELSKLESVASDFPDGSVLKEAVEHVTASVRAGTDLIVAEEAEFVSPAVAAKFIGVSRTHLYKLLDAGEIPSRNAGRDRRLALRDVRDYVIAQDSVRREAAERFAHPDRSRGAALDAFKAKRRPKK